MSALIFLFQLISNIFLIAVIKVDGFIARIEIVRMKIGDDVFRLRLTDAEIWTLNSFSSCHRAQNVALLLPDRLPEVNMIS